MKRISLTQLALIMALMVTPAWSQTVPQSGAPATGAGNPADPAKQHHHPRFLDKLNLSEAQKSQIKQIHETVPDKKEARQQIMAVLTPEQKAELKQMVQEWRKNHPHHQGNNDNKSVESTSSDPGSSTQTGTTQKVTPLNI